MRILVATASRQGSTAEIGVELGKSLRAASTGGVDVVPVEHVAALDGYDAVVLGSAVYRGRWLDSARWWATAQAESLRGLPLWLFSTGPVGEPPIPSTVPVDPVQLAADLGARDHVVFAGRLHRERLGPEERLAVGAANAPEGDFRDWPAVRAWADRIVAELRVGSMPR